MIGLVGSTVTAVVGAVLVLVVSLVGYTAVPSIIDSIIINEVTLLSDSVQMERFEQVPFPLNFSVRVWRIDNQEEVLAGGVPVMSEVGPYIYKLYQTRVVKEISGDNITYERVDYYEFDPITSHPHTEDDNITIINPAFHTLLQRAETIVPETAMTLINNLLGNIFGANNSPIVTVRVRDLFFDGIPICENPGVIGGVACSIVRTLAEDVQNIRDRNGTMVFSFFYHRNGQPSGEYVASRGLNDPTDVGRIHLLNGLPTFRYWPDPAGQSAGSGFCNMVNGTDSGIFQPFVTPDIMLYAINTDICRSVRLEYQYDSEYEGIPALRFAANEWFLANDDGCFCLNVTDGINRDDGCLLQGAMEMFTCIGVNMVLTYPHFLFADFRYRNGIIGTNPDIDRHRIFMDLEPNTGTVVRGQKRAQFNVFMRPVPGIAATTNLRTTLTPIFWVEEGMSLPQEYVEEVTAKLLTPLRLVEILVPVLIALSAIVLAVGLTLVVIAKSRKPADLPTTNIVVPPTRPALLK